MMKLEKLDVWMLDSSWPGQVLDSVSELSIQATVSTVASDGSRSSSIQQSQHREFLPRGKTGRSSKVTKVARGTRKENIDPRPEDSPQLNFA